MKTYEQILLESLNKSNTLVINQIKQIDVKLQINTTLIINQEQNFTEQNNEIKSLLISSNFTKLSLLQDIFYLLGKYEAIHYCEFSKLKLIELYELL